MKQQLIDILTKYGSKNYWHHFKKEHSLIIELKTIYGDLPYNELFYCGINDYTETYCEYNNKKTFTDISKGYKQSCKPGKNCKCLKAIRAKQTVTGVNNPDKKQEYQDKIKQTNLEKYGVEYPIQNKDIKEKIKQTNLERYGVEYGFQNEEIKNKITNTMLERYGVKHALLNPDIFEKRNKTNVERYGVEHALQNIITQNQIKSIKFSWNCNDISRCPTCYPVIRSLWESEIQNYIKQHIDIKSNTYSIIKPYELDIYIPNKNIAIECNGSYWHSELNGKHKNYHLNKTELCEEQNIQLLHIWEHEYINNPDLIKSLIKTKLDLNECIPVTKTQIQVIDNKTKELFLDNNHLQGNRTSKHNIGLYHNNELVALMAFSFNENYEYELIRYCSKHNIDVIGGASKLFKYFIKNYNPNSIIGYADRRYSKGNMYKQLGFEFIENSPPNFKYTKDYKTTHCRLQLQKKHLDVFDDTLTVDQNIINNGYDKLWDCGNSVWVWKK